MLLEDISYNYDNGFNYGSSLRSKIRTDFNDSLLSLQNYYEGIFSVYFKVNRTGERSSSSFIMLDLIVSPTGITEDSSIQVSQYVRVPFTFNLLYSTGKHKSSSLSRVDMEHSLIIISQILKHLKQIESHSIQINTSSLYEINSYENTIHITANGLHYYFYETNNDL